MPLKVYTQNMNEQVRAPRRIKAAHSKLLTQKLLRAGVLTPAKLIQAPTKIKSTDRPYAPIVVSSYSQPAAQLSSARSGVLVFCSFTKPGGGWENGAVAQEEDISLQSSWGIQAQEAQPGFYQTKGDNDGLGSDCVLMAEGVWFSDSNGRPLIKPQPVVFAGVAAPNRKSPHLHASPNIQIDHLARRLTAALDAWSQMGVDRVVLGAIGCGVFAWPGEESAYALRQALGASVWKGELVLAMPDAKLAAIFKTVLSADHPPHPCPPQKTLKKSKQ